MKIRKNLYKNVYSHREGGSIHNPHTSSGALRFAGPASWDSDPKITYYFHISSNRKVSYDINGLQTPKGLEVHTEFSTGRPKSIIYSIAGTELKMPVLEYIAKQLVGCIKRRKADIDIKPEEEAVLNPYALNYISFENFVDIIKHDKELRKGILKYEPSLEGKL